MRRGLYSGLAVQRTSRRPRRRGITALAIGVLAMLLATTAWAFFTSSGSGAASATAASLTAPAAPTVPSTVSGNTVAVSWTGVAGPSSPSVGYWVRRYVGATASNACGTTLAAPLFAGTGPKTCNDTPVSPGAYTYTVTAVWRTWTAQSAASGSVTVQNDVTPPTVSSINRADASPTNASTVSWTVTFSENVTGVDTTDFAIVGTGLGTSAVTGVVGANNSYTVTASTGSGGGTRGLNLVDNDSIVDAVGLKLGGTGAGNGNFTGEVYTIDRTAPTLTALEMLDTNGNGKVDRVDATYDDTLAASPTGTWTLTSVPSGGTLGAVTIVGNQVRVGINEGAGSVDTTVGSFKVSLSGSTPTDALGNAVAAFTNSTPADKAAPVRVSMTMLDQVSGANGRVDTVTAVFSESLAAYSAGTTPWTLANVPSGGSLNTVTVATNTATLNLTPGAGAPDTAVGSFTVALATSAIGIRDAFGNMSSFAAAAPGDGAAPILVSVTSTPGTTAGKMEATNTIAFTYSEAVTSVPVSPTVTENRAGSSTTLTIPSLIQTATINTSYVQANSSGSAPAGTALSNGNKTVTATLGAVSTTGSGVSAGTGSVTIFPAGVTDASANAVVTTVSATLSLLF
jgi:hypothetical protein